MCGSAAVHVWISNPGYITFIYCNDNVCFSGPGRPLLGREFFTLASVRCARQPWNEASGQGFLSFFLFASGCSSFVAAFPVRQQRANGPIRGATGSIRVSTSPCFQHRICMYDSSAWFSLQHRRVESTNKNTPRGGMADRAVKQKKPCSISLQWTPQST